ncbi:MAG: rhamnulokinase [Christensenellales bacterium]|jgi:rhamnulokinase
MKTRNIMGFDLGASSGRAILGRFDGQRLTLQEVHRFGNGPVPVGGTLYWNTLGLFEQMQQALIQYKKTGGALDAIGIDTWGVDYGLLDKHGRLLGNVVHYRDGRTQGVDREVYAVVPKEEIFARTGIAYQVFNTLFQLRSMTGGRDSLIDHASTLLFMPDLLRYFMTGETATEYSIASTSQLLDAKSRDFDRPLLDKLGIPTRIFTPIVQPGTPCGRLNAAMQELTGLPDVPMIATAGHDTAAAVAAVPAQGRDFAYLSSGTWSLMGVEMDQPLLSQAVMAANLTNEGGVGGSIRLLRNIMGMWLIQQCKQVWDREGEPVGYGQLVAEAQAAPAFASLINPDDDLFYAPGDMPSRIAQYCQRTGQPVPQSRGAITRCVYESLAMAYRWAFLQLERLAGRPLKALHIVGGGSQNALLNQFTANAIGREVVAGPTEATAIGNILVQAMGLGEIGDLDQLRQVVAASFPVERFQPEDTDRFQEVYQTRYLPLVG